MNTPPLFLSPLRFTHVGLKAWRLVEPLRYRLSGRFNNNIIEVPENFLTDFASVPDCLSWLLRRDGNYKAAAVIHDYLYRTKTLHNALSRAQCDAIFLEAMGVLNIAFWKKALLYTGVRMFGSAAYNKIN